MKIIKKECEGNLVTLEIEADRNSYLASIERTMKEVILDTKIPGFRSGKAPRHLVEKQINMAAVEDKATNDLMADLYPEVIRAAEIEPVDYPKVELLKKEASGPLVFKLQISVYPEVKLGKYKGIKAEQKSTEVKDEEVTRFLESLQNRIAKVTPVKERSIQNGDLVDLDLIAKVDGKSFAPLTRKGIKIQIGQGSISPEFDQEVIGLNVGDMKNFEITFKKDHPIAEVQEKQVSFETKVLQISQKEAPPLDDDFAKKMSRFTTLEELTAEIKNNLTKEKEMAVEGEVKDKLIEEAVANAEMEVPEALVAREIDSMLHEFERSLAQSGLTLDKYLQNTKKTEEELRNEMKESAVARTKSKLVLKAIAEKEKIEVSDEDVDNELKQFAEKEGKTFDEFKANLRPAVKEYIVDYLSRHKALDFLKEHAKISMSKEVKQLFQA